MAVLEKIRSRMGILISIIIGISLLAFILTDFLGSGKSVLRGKQFEIAEIAGKSVNFKEYEKKVKDFEDNYKYQSGQSNVNEETTQKIRDEVWQLMVEEYVMEDEYNELSIEVTPKELLDMVEGANPHPIIRQIFTNPDTKQLNRAGIIQFIKNLDKEKDAGKKAVWNYIEEQISRERIMTKYLNLVKKGLYVTTDQANSELKNNTKKVNFNFIFEKLSSISDSVLKIRESEIEKYYNKHKADFLQEASRDIDYISFDIVPSQEDFDQAQKWIENITPDFKSTAEIKQFVSLNSDVPFNDKYLKESELPDTIKKFMFTAKIGGSFGPYYENSTFKIARLVDIKNLPDSVRARHILIKPDAQTEESVKKAEKTADSLKNILKKHADFAALAKMYSADNGSATKGGDVGWFRDGTMVKPFSDACFFGKKGDIVVVTSQFGFHVIEITEKGKEIKKVQVGIVERKVEPSNNTIQAIYQKASAFAGNYNTGDKFEAGAKKQGLTPKVASNLDPSMRDVPGIEKSRELIHWVFKAELNTISGVIELGNKFVIAHLTQMREKGPAPLNQVRDQIILSVKKEKKADQLYENMKKEISGVKDLEGLATKVNLPVYSANDISFNSYVIPNAGFEPSIISAALAVLPNKLSEPVKGNNGVYVLSVANVTDKDQEQVNPKMSKMRISSMFENRANYEAFTTLKKLAKIDDKRINFY